MASHQALEDKAVEALRLVLPDYGFDPDDSLILLSVSENRTYRIDPRDQSSSPAIIRLHRFGYHSVQEIESEVQWVEALACNETVPLAAPIRTMNGAASSSVNLGGRDHRVTVWRFLHGAEAQLDAGSPGRFQVLGSLTARLHDHAKRWSPPAGFVRKRWTFEAMLGVQGFWGDWRDAKGLTQEGLSILSKVEAVLSERLGAFGMGPDRFGLIHGDLRLANLLEYESVLSVIDFDDCGFSWFAYDFASAVSFHEDDPRLKALMAAWLEGYRQVAPFEAEAEQMLPTFVMLRRMLLTAWLSDRPDTDLASELGASFTETTVELGKRYLAGGLLDP